MASLPYARYVPPSKAPATTVDGNLKPNLPAKRKLDIAIEEQDDAPKGYWSSKKTRTSKRTKTDQADIQNPTQITIEGSKGDAELVRKKENPKRKFEHAEPSNEDEQLASLDRRKKTIKHSQDTSKKKRKRCTENEAGDDARIGAAKAGDLSVEGVQRRGMSPNTLVAGDVLGDTQERDTGGDIIYGVDDNELKRSSKEADASKGPQDDNSKHNAIMSKFHRTSLIAEIQAKKNAAVASNNGKGVKHTMEAAQSQGLVPLPQPAEVPDSVAKPTFSGLPAWLATPITVSSTSPKSFGALGVSSKLAITLEAKGYKEASPIQSAILPMLLPGQNKTLGDICISAATGSGKTLAYALPIIESLRSRIDPKIRALIVMPTRELVAQAREVFELCAAGSGLKVETAVGNRSLKTEQERIIAVGQRCNFEPDDILQTEPDNVIRNSDYDGAQSMFNVEDEVETLPGHTREYLSKVDVLICTPGRLVDHIRLTRGFTLDYVQWFVVDEADRLLNQSFQEWVAVVMNALEGEKPYEQLGVGDQLELDMGYRRAARDIRKVLLSATMTKDLEKLNAFKLRRPQLVVLDSTADGRPTNAAANLGPDQGRENGAPDDVFVLPATLHENAVAVGDGHEKPLYLLQLLLTHRSIIPESDIAKSPSSFASRDTLDISDDETSSSGSDTSPSPSSSASGCTSTSTADEEATSQKRSKDAKKTAAKSPKTSRRSVLVFTNNNENATRLSRLLSIIHPPLTSRIGTLTKSSATSTGRKTLAAFRAGKLSVLIASDRASRGLDVPNLAHVVNYDMPTSVTAYVHRVGRTARAGQYGQAWTFTAKTEARWFWNEIVRGPHIRRAPGMKVQRVKLGIDAVGHEGRRAYRAALQTLQAEVEGSRTV